MSKVRLLLITAAALVVGILGTTTAAQASTGIRSSATSIGASGILTLNGIVRCQVLIQLNLTDATIGKVAGTREGTASGGFIRACTGATDGTINGSIPVFYNGFTGTLPNISTIPVTGGATGALADFTLNGIPFCGTARYAGVLSPITFNISGGVVRSVSFTGSNRIARTAGGALCPTDAGIQGDLNAFLPSAPTLTLV